MSDHETRGEALTAGVLMDKAVRPRPNAHRRTEHVIVGLVPDRWTGPSQSRHQVFSKLASESNVIWSGPRPSIREIRAGRLRSRLVEHSARHLIAEVESGLLEARVHRAGALRNFMDARYARLLARVAASLGRQSIVSLWRPEYLRIALGIDPVRLIYHVDDEYTFSPDEPDVTPMERDALERADVTIFTSTRLAERKSQHCREFRIIPHGVDVSRFRSARSLSDALPGIPKPRLCYVGRIKNQLDFELLHAVATHDDSWQLVLCGGLAPHAEAEKAYARLLRLPNVHAVPMVDHDTVPSIMASCDIGLLPYVVDGYSRNIQPLKLAEYLAAGLPVVSSMVPAVAELSGPVISVARDQREFILEIERLLAIPADTVARATLDVALTRDWSKILTQLRAVLLGDTNPAPDSAPW